MRARGQPSRQVTDPAVTRAKYANEIEHFRANADSYRRQGCMLVEERFPTVHLLLGGPQLRPSPVFFGLVIDFTNYDAVPPSVRLVNPWTREPLRRGQFALTLPRFTQNAPDPTVSPESPLTYSLAEIVQSWQPPFDVPFLCARGIREYHWHPGHTGDSWWLHRKRGEGTLGSLVALLTSHGPQAVAGYAFQFGGRMQKVGPNAFLSQLQITAVGYALRTPDGNAVVEAY
jgi:hypothetical protein